METENGPNGDRQVSQLVKVIECPRDAMQGIEDFIPTETKIRYLNKLLEVGFDTLDFGSFVSPKTVPQMRDTKNVLAGLRQERSNTSLLAIIANTRGALEALEYPAIAFLGFPISISETFQKKNTNKSISESLAQLAEIQEACKKKERGLVAYISMGFGNPYGDPYSPEIVLKFVEVLRSLDISIISVADTVGLALPTEINTLFKSLTGEYTSIELGVHLHASPKHSKEKVEAAISAGCQRIDGALLGLGGCPMAEDDLVGNIDTTIIKEVLDDGGKAHTLENDRFLEALVIAREVFSGLT